MLYAAYEVERGGFADFARGFFAGGGRGLNVTVPFKEDALDFADGASAFALRARAANVLVLRDGGGIFACNTDGAGLVRDIRHNLGVEIFGRRVLLVGAGGAARAAALAFAEQRPSLLHIAARKIKAAEDLAELAGISHLRSCPPPTPPIKDGGGEKRKIKGAENLAELAAQGFPPPTPPLGVGGGLI